MARLPYVEMQEASPEVREIYENVLRGKPGSVQKLLAHRPEVLKTFLAFYGTVGARSTAASTRWCTSASP